MIEMRDGTEVADARLGRLKLFDDKSKDFPVRAALSAEQTKPRSYTWSCQNHYDQLRTSQCVSYAWHHELTARPVVEPYPENTPTQQLLFAERYYAMQRIDPWIGGEYPGAYPKYAGTAVLAGAKIMQSLGKIKEYRWAFGINDLILAIGYKGPGILGVTWKTDMFYPDAKGFIHASGEDEGGHAIMCKGVNLKGEYFTLHQSWGLGFGIHGDVKISFADMVTLLHEDGEACIPMFRTKTPN